MRKCCVWVLSVICCLSWTVNAGQVTIEIDVGYDTLTMSDAHSTIQGYLDQYQRENPHVTIENIGRTGNYLVRILAGEGPDIINMHQTDIRQLTIANALLQVPTDLVADLEKEYYPVTLEGLRFQGKLWGIPTENQVSGLLYNTRLLREAGIAGPPRTWDELRSLAPKLTIADANGNVIRPAMVAETGTEMVVKFFHALLVGEGGALMDSAQRNFLFAEPPGPKVGEMLHEFYSVKRYVSGPWADVMRFGAGEIPLGWGWPWWAHTMPKDSLEWVDTIQVTSSPAGAAGPGDVQYGWGLVVNRNTKVEDEVWRLISWLSLRMDRGYSAYGHSLAVFGSLPNNRYDIRADFFRRDPKFTFYNAFAENMQRAVATPVLPEAVAKTLGHGVLDVAFGITAPETGLLETARLAQIQYQDMMGF